MTDRPERILIVGSGQIGGALARWLDHTGRAPVLCSRYRPTEPELSGILWQRLDATSRADWRSAMRAYRPCAVVAVHGPSDVTWCEANPARALAAHRDAAAHLAERAKDLPVVLVSTDNVFAGDRTGYDETAQPVPANAYGRAKLAAEQVLLDRCANATVLRVSLVYGWARPRGSWLNYFTSCADRLLRGERIDAPADHWTTPVLLDDTVRVVAALLGGACPGLMHLGGPDRISRFAWATRIATALGFPADRVAAVARADSRYACRPVNACLNSIRLGVEPATRDITVRGIEAGLAALAANAPQWWVTPDGVRRQPSAPRR